MLVGKAKRVFTSGPAGPAGGTLASALTDVVAAIKAALIAPDLPTARAALGLGNVANLAPADYPVSTAQAAAIAAAIAALVNSSPATLDTLKELADALGEDPNFAATVAAQLGLKAPAARVIAAGTGLAGGGDLSTDRTLALAAIATGGFLANIAGTSAAPVPTTLSAFLDAVVGTGRGGLLVRGASGWGPLALGASGTTLQSNGTDAVFAAASPGTGALRYDTSQSLGDSAQEQGRENVGLYLTGLIGFFPMASPPLGYLKANGAAVSRSSYARLYAAIGTTFGTGDGSTTFNLPDLRGQFLRAFDDGRGIDSGRTFGSAQADALQGHQHGLLMYQATGGGQPAASATATNSITAATGGALLSDGTNGTPRTAAETRPTNVALLACIKY